MRQKDEFLDYVTEEYKKAIAVDPNAKVTEMTQVICEKYLKNVRAEVEAKDCELPEPKEKLEFIELGETLPETAKPNLKDYIHKKLNQINAMEIPESVFEHLQKKHLMSEKNSKRYVHEYKKYIMCALASKIAVTPSEQTDLVWHTHICTNSIYPHQMAKVMFKKRLGRFDHGPTKGGSAEGIRFEEQYTRTLEIYQYLS